jgi:hypothetical protein
MLEESASDHRHQRMAVNALARIADEPSLVTGQILLTLVPDPLRGAIDDPVLQGHLPARHLRQQEDGGGDDLRRQ